MSRQEIPPDRGTALGTGTWDLSPDAMILM